MKDSRKKKTDIFASTVVSGFVLYTYTRSARSNRVAEDNQDQDQSIVDDLFDELMSAF